MVLKLTEILSETKYLRVESYVCMYAECPGEGGCVDVCAADGVGWVSKRRLLATGGWGCQRPSAWGWGIRMECRGPEGGDGKHDGER